MDALGIKVWDLNTPGNYTVSNAAEAEVIQGIARLQLDRTPLHVGTITDDATTVLGGARYIAVVGDNAYVSVYDDSGVEILDISNPTAPTHVGSITDDATTELLGALDIKVVGNYAYVTGSLDQGVEILDISNPAAPAHVGAIDNNAPGTLSNSPRGIDVVATMPM